MVKKTEGLRRKAIALSLVLSFLPLIIVSYVSYIAVDSQYSAMHEGFDSFHRDFTNLTQENITSLVNSYMYGTALSYASLMEDRIEDCREVVNTQAAYIEYMLEKNLTVSGMESYTQDSPPSDVFYSEFYGKNISLASSVYLLAPHTDPANESSPPVNYSDVQRDIDLTSLMDPLWVSLYNRTDSPILWFYISTESGVHRSYPWHAGYAEDYDARTRNWYVNSTANVTFTSPYYGASGGGLLISVNRAIYVNGEKYGVVAMDISLSCLAEVIPSPSPLPVNRTFIIDTEGNVISHPSLTPFLESLMQRENLTWKDDIPLINITELESNSTAFNGALSNITAGLAGQESCPCQDGRKYLTYVPINGTNWMLVIVVNADEVDAMKDAFMSAVHSFEDYTGSRIQASRYNTFLIFFPIVAFVALISMSLSLMFADSMVYPVISLKDEVDKVSKDLDHPISIEGTGEIADLGRSFELMRLQLKEDMEELRKKNRISASLNAHLIRLQNDVFEKSERIKHLYHESLKAGEAREAMLQMLAHELRTPLTAIRGNQQMLERELLNEHREEKVKRRLESMDMAVERLTALVNDSLLLLTLERKGYEIMPESFSVDEWIEEAAEKVPAIKGQSQVLKKDIGVKNVVGDRSLLTKALKELLRNASHYSPPGSEIEVAVRGEKGGIHLIVRDHGPGIPRKEWKAIFQPFYVRKGFREHEPGRRAMGLAIVRLIVERHDGSVWVESGENGTSMHIWLVQSGADIRAEVG